MEPVLENHEDLLRKYCICQVLNVVSGIWQLKMLYDITELAFECLPRSRGSDV